MHAGTDYGKYTDQVNEYLSCIQLSDEAFYNLVEYFSDSDRPVIVCMCGDHCPSIATKITSKSIDENDTRLYMTPFVIWSNFDLADKAYINESYTTGISFLMPYLMDVAGIPTSRYYKQINKLTSDYPAITANGYIDNDGVMHSYDAPEGIDEKINEYFCLEYNCLSSKDRMDEMFKIDR